MIVIVGGLKLDVHQINCSHGGNQEENLHCRIIDRNETCEQVQVTCYKHETKQELRSSYYKKRI